MPVGRCSRLAFAFALVGVVAGCKGAATASPIVSGSVAATRAQDSSVQPAPTSTCSLQLGVAGLIPPNFPSPSAQDWTAMYASVSETGSLLGVYTNWSDSTATEGEVPRIVATAFGLAPTYGFTPFVAIGFHRDVAGGGLASSVSWADSAERTKAVQAVVAIARQYRPRYLALGVEVNRAYEKDRAGFDEFVSGYDEMYGAIKGASSATLVFPIFQLEMTKGNGYLLGGSEARQPEWTLLDRFAGRMDVAAFTTYPFLDAASPADLPADYYSEIATHTSKPIAFTEIGWPSAPISSAPKSAYGGSPDEQASFASRFFDLTESLDVTAALWAFPDDVNPDYPNAAMTSVSLRDNHGAAKPALAVWTAKAKAPCGSAA